MDPCKLKFIQEKMRAHLQKCLISGACEEEALDCSSMEWFCKNCVSTASYLLNLYSRRLCILQHCIGVGTGGAGGAIAPPLFLGLVAWFTKAFILSTTNTKDALILMLTTHKTFNLTTIFCSFLPSSPRLISSSATKLMSS